MPFGKFRGVWLEDLPYSYLAWLHELENLREPLRSEVNRVWSERFDEDERDAPRPDFPDEERTLIRELLEAGYRALSLRMHPDCGGSHESMLRLNQLMNKLRTRGVLVA